MRLDFNYILIDDDWGNYQNKRRVEFIIDKINRKIEDKGLIPKPNIYKNIAEFQNDIGNLDQNRFDLYLSDNNLGNANTGNDNNSHANDGIEIYLQLHEHFPCDFVLYSGATQDDIINKLVFHLTSKKDAGLFSRFTFVSRSSDRNDKWYEKILDLIDLIISSREEMNTMRGFYAQLTSQIHEYISQELGKDYKTLKDAIIGLKSNISKYGFTETDIDELDAIRLIRNGLVHRDERKKPNAPHTYYLTYADINKVEQEVYIQDFQKYRVQLRDMHTKIKKAFQIP